MKSYEFRTRFPIFRRRIYVTVAPGRLSTDVEEAMRAYLDTWTERLAVEMWVKGRAPARAFAASIGADVDEIAVMPSASAGINAIARRSASPDGGRMSHRRFEFPTMAQCGSRRSARRSIRRAAPVGISDTLRSRRTTP